MIFGRPGPDSEEADGDTIEPITPEEQAIIDEMERQSIEAVRQRVFDRAWLVAQ